jgi:hypothetical protein
MSSDHHEIHRIAAPLAHRVEKDAGAEQIAEEAVALWHEIDRALSPIIGKGGVAALYRRSLHVSGAVHPWLASSHEGAPMALDPAPLKLLLAKQSNADAASGSRAVLQAFHALLSTLIGAVLTEQLLGSVWSLHLSSAPAQDSSP